MKITTKEYVDGQIKWLEKVMNAHVGSMEKAVDKVEKTNTAKFEAQNEWRSQFKDQTATFITRREMWAAVLAIAGLTIAAIKLLQ